MKIKQLKGPFKKGERIIIPPQYGYKYVHIGIQTLSHWPIAQWEDGFFHDRKGRIPERLSYGQGTEAIPQEIMINDIPYHINQTGILEFDGLSESKWTIVFLVDMPMETIIDIVYKEEEI